METQLQLIAPVPAETNEFPTLAEAHTRSTATKAQSYSQAIKAAKARNS